MEEYSVIEDPVWRFRRLEPKPEAGELSRFYQSKYCDLVHQGKRGPDLARLMGGGREAKWESDWLGATLYADILWLGENHIEGGTRKRVLDIGCGTGEFLAFMEGQGWSAIGLEPSAEIAAVARDRGLDVRPDTLEEYALVWESEGSEPFALVSLLNVLEHVPDPIQVLRVSMGLLAKPDGLLVVKVPNDFNQLQLAAQEVLNKERWWVAIPDHVNYFSFSTLSFVLRELGFEVIYTQSDFPMEMFLLMGYDYVKDPDVGKQCHERRVRFETSISAESRRSWYRALADAGIGRNCLLCAKVAAT